MNSNEINTNTTDTNQYNVLIVEDHPLVMDAYRKVLDQLVKEREGISFNITEALNGDMAHRYITEASGQQHIDLFFLDIQLPSNISSKLYSGETIGALARELFPKSKIMVCTGVNDAYRLDNIFKAVRPDGFLVKSDIGPQDLIEALKTILAGNYFYSQTILDIMRKRMTETVSLDKQDVLLLHELSNGSKMKDLLELMPLTKSGIERRKKVLREKLRINGNSDRDLVLEAKKKGYI
ncbi:two-component system response regulator NarL [Flavobacteriaceae bacterium MHTCC 0001]